ncbi:MAG: hypothetical protein GC182_03170 [Rhodopseudomonas sp.]|nr:hypothetical protein [Rhodopseudomonas sp.]
MKHPHEGGRYYREKDNSLTRAGNDAAGRPNKRKPAPAAGLADKDTARKDGAPVSANAKDKTNA